MSWEGVIAAIGITVLENMQREIKPTKELTTMQEQESPLTKKYFAEQDLKNRLPENWPLFGETEEIELKTVEDSQSFTVDTTVRGRYAR